MMDVKILSTVKECTFTSIYFASNSITTSYTIGDEPFTVPIPSLMSSPDCGNPPVVESKIAAPLVVPEGINVSDYITVDFALGAI